MFAPDRWSEKDIMKDKIIERYSTEFSIYIRTERI